MEESMKDYERELEASFRTINEGDVIKGTVIDVTDEEVTLDLKYYTQGIIKVTDLSEDPNFSVLDDVKIGDEIEATVMKTDDGNGNIVLSKKEANKVLAWDVLKQLKETPYSRRIMTNLYQFHDLATGHLDPCCYSATYNVTKDRESGKLVLNMVLNQRSQDILAANNWNVCQYAILLMMVAQVNDMIPGQLIHVIADAHIYDRHVDAIKELLSRPELPAPKVRLNPEVKNFYDFTTDDLIVEGYEAGEQIRSIPIAV